jgi:hypothetical protein
MIIDYNSLMDDVEKILKTIDKKIRHYHKGKIHTEKFDFYVTNITSIDLVRDYTANIGDVIMAKMMIPLGTYTYKLYPYRDNLEISIETETISELGGKDNKPVPVSVERYKAVLAGDFPKPAKNDTINTNEDTMNNTFIDIELQLIQRNVEPLRIKTTQGIMRDQTYFNAVHAILGGEASKTIIEGKPSIDALDVVPFDNKENQKYIVLPSNMLVTSLATMLQNRMGGLYYHGVGQYLQTFRKKKFWFVYPLYNTNRYTQHKVPKIHIYVVPQQRFPELDNTFRIENPDLLEIVCNDSQRYLDDANNNSLAFGTGIRAGHSSSYMTDGSSKKIVKMNPKGPMADRKSINYEFNSGNRKDNLNYSPTGANEINSNPFYEYSVLAKRDCGRVELTWQHSEVKHIYPNMPVRVFFIEDKTVKIVDGVVNALHTSMTIEGPATTGRKHVQKSMLTIDCGYYLEGGNMDNKKLGNVDAKLPESYPVVDNKTTLYS